MRKAGFFKDNPDISGDLISFRWTYKFEGDGETLFSDSTLKFRSKDEIMSSLESAGFSIVDIRDAPDRPKKEFVFICKKVST
jgi:hypothetical protein